MLELGPLKIHWYGFLIAIGAVLGFLVVLYFAKKYKLKKDHVYNLAFWVIIFGLIGDRLYYVFYAWEYYSHNLLDIFKIWQGGLAIHGAMIAGIIVIYLYAKKHKLNPWFLADLAVIALPLAMAFGRWGNYFNMELFGSPTDLPWGIFIAEEKRPTEFFYNTHFHPTFLYESIANLLIFLVLFICHFIKSNKNTFDKYKGAGPEPEQVRYGAGNIVLTYFILYSIVRFSNEFLRLDWSPYFLGLRWAQFTSLVILFICFIIIIYKIFKKFKKTKPD